MNRRESCCSSPGAGETPSLFPLTIDQTARHMRFEHSMHLLNNVKQPARLPGVWRKQSLRGSISDAREEMMGEGSASQSAAKSWKPHSHELISSVIIGIFCYHCCDVVCAGVCTCLCECVLLDECTFCICVQARDQTQMSSSVHLCFLF